MYPRGRAEPPGCMWHFGLSPFKSIMVESADSHRLFFPLYIYKDVKIPGYSHRRLFFGRFVLLNGGELCGETSKDAFLLRGDAGRGEHQDRVKRVHDLLRSLH